MTGPSDSSVPVEALPLIRRAAHQLRAWHVKYSSHLPDWLPPGGDVRWLEDAAAYLNAVAPSDEQIIQATNTAREDVAKQFAVSEITVNETSLEFRRAFARALLEQAARALPVAALSDADRTAMEQARAEALEEAAKEALRHTTHPDDPANEVWQSAYNHVAAEIAAAIRAIGALRTRLDGEKT